MKRFHIVEDGAVIIRQAGTFRQVDLYQRGEFLYAKHRGGFVQLLGGDTNGGRGTSVPDITWYELDAGRPYTADTFGRPIIKERTR